MALTPHGKALEVGKGIFDAVTGRGAKKEFQKDLDAKLEEHRMAKNPEKAKKLKREIQKGVARQTFKTRARYERWARRAALAGVLATGSYKGCRAAETAVSGQAAETKEIFNKSVEDIKNDADVIMKEFGNLTVEFGHELRMLFVLLQDTSRLYAIGKASIEGLTKDAFDVVEGKDLGFDKLKQALGKILQKDPQLKENIDRIEEIAEKIKGLKGKIGTMASKAKANAEEIASLERQKQGIINKFKEALKEEFIPFSSEPLPLTPVLPTESPQGSATISIPFQTDPTSTSTNSTPWIGNTAKPLPMNPPKGVEDKREK